MRSAMGRTPCCTFLLRPDSMAAATMSWTNPGISTEQKPAMADRPAGDLFTSGRRYLGFRFCTRLMEPTALLPTPCARTVPATCSERPAGGASSAACTVTGRSEKHTSELPSPHHLLY